MVDRSDNEILEGWSTSDLKSLPTFESVVPRNLPKVSVQTVLNSPDAYSLIIDVRSEKEFEESHLPGALSFPILNNEERHEVGLLYKNLGRPQAVQRALNAAVPKLSNLEKLLQKQVRNAGPVLLYCWRGGGRSAYTQNQILKMGFEAFSLDGGHKSYRKEVYETLYNRKGPRFLVL